MYSRQSDVAAPVRARLLNLARERGQAMDLLLTRYTLERLLHRLSLSSYRERFVLKGPMLLATWIPPAHRITRDIDLLGFGDSRPESALATFRDICGINVTDDGVEFDRVGMKIDAVREGLVYGGVRLRTTATLAGARIAVVVDIGFGDAVAPGIEEIDLPVLLGMPSPRLRAYPRETVIAEKFQAMTALGRANSRMKDFYDIWMLMNTYNFDTARLANAIAATFERRMTVVPSNLPDALTSTFAQDASKQRQWAAFSRALALDLPSLETVVDSLARRMMPVVAIASRTRR